MPDSFIHPTDTVQTAAALSQRSLEELLHLGMNLGLALEVDTPREEIIRRIRRRQELLLELDRNDLVTVLAWAKRPVDPKAGKDALAREITAIQRTDYEHLPLPGLATLARLRGLNVSPAERPEQLIARLRKHDGFWKRFGRWRRSATASLVMRLMNGGSKSEAPNAEDTKPSPQSPAAEGRPSLREHMEEHGVMAGLATRIRSAADDYVRQKMDEIEARIDAKLDEIDHRLAEWRDREVANRLKILRLTLIFTVLVAVLSLGYNILKSRVAVDAPTPPVSKLVEP